MKNKKGFTLIELLAVIVILAILLIIAIPKILDVISNARVSAWVNSTGLIKHAIEVNTQTPDPTTGTYRYTVKGLCNNETSSDVDVTNNIRNIAKVSDMNIKCKKSTDYIFTLNGENKFSERVSTITCDASGKCSSNIVSNNSGNSSGGNESTPSETGYTTSSNFEKDDNGNIISWTELNSEWSYYLKKNTTTDQIELCGVYPNGPVCFSINPSNYDNDLEDCVSAYNNNDLDAGATYDGTESTCIKGYAKQKADEMLTKGASVCHIYIGDPSSVYCEGSNNLVCSISDYSGEYDANCGIEINESMNDWCQIYSDNDAQCE